MALALARLRSQGARVIVASDFSREMLSIARRKFEGKGIETLEADAMHLPLADSSLDLVVAAFGFRNLVNYENALREIYRVLAAGGQVAILEAAEPRGLLGSLYRIYFHWVLPKLGAAISGSASAYRYLPASVQRFPAPADLLVTMRRVGFSGADWTPYSFGIAGLFRAKKIEEPL
jgi:demethylmenaquinone methyltransferase/2-methoxy-6-polyprenyl-1,4-benzoquinol methylase